MGIVTHLVTNGLVFLFLSATWGNTQNHMNQTDSGTRSSETGTSPKKLSRKDDGEECLRPPPIIPPKFDVEKLTLWELMAKSEKDLELHDGKGVLIVGHSGSGKTTVALTIAQNLTNLTVYEDDGESLLILDKEQRIGMSTKSRTLVPELILDPETNLYLYDFPQFRETRPKVDITGKYLMRKVTDKLTSVRIVLTVSEDSVSGGGAKGDFGSLIGTLAEMIQDIDKMKSGIGMIVTKVTNLNARGKFRDDKAALKGIVSFLEQYKQEEQEKLIESKSGRTGNQENKLDNAENKRLRRSDSSSWNVTKISSTDNQEIIQKKIRLIDILLQEDKITIFRSPDACGSFDQSTWSQENKDGIIKLIKNELEWVRITNKDINYTVSSDSLVQLDGLYKELNSNVTQLVTEIVNVLRESQRGSPLDVKDYFTLNESVHADYGNFSEVLEIGEASGSPEFIGITIQSAMSARGYDQNLSVQFLSNMRIISSRMNFFDSITPNGLTYERTPQEWLKSWKSWVSNEVEGRKEWYEFLWNARNAFSSFEFQANVPSSVPNDILGVKKALGTKGIIVTENVVKYYDSARIIQEDVDILWAVVNEAFEKPVISCNSESPPEMLVTGSIVKVSDFTTASDSRPVLCNGKHPSRVVVYATRKFLIERSVLPKAGPTWDTEIGVVSPEWDVSRVNSFGIYLNGEPGADGTLSAMALGPLNSSKKDYFLYKSSDASTYSVGRSWDIFIEEFVQNLTQNHRSKRSETNYIRRLREGYDKLCMEGEYPKNGKRGNDGTVGKPGQHGGPAGNFIGLSFRMGNVDKLFVDINGGKGGAGKSGEYGYNGGDGDSRSLGLEKLYYDNNSYPICKGECSKVGETCSGSWATKEWDYCYRPHEIMVYCRMDMCIGGQGGNGGDGGAGGRGGIQGSAFIITASGSQKATVRNVAGVNGEDGAGGNGGTGGTKGKTGNHYYIQLNRNNECELGYFFDLKKVLPGVPPYTKKSASGSTGKKGANKSGQKEQRNPSYKITPSEIYFSYRDYALTKRSVYFPQQHFIDFLDGSPDFLKTFTPMHFAKELLSLEESHLRLKIQEVERDSVALKMIPQYNSFLTRLNNYVKTNGNLQDSSRKFLSLLYSLGLNQLRILKQVTGTPLVVDVMGYLKAVQDRLDVYNNIKDNRDKKNLVEGERTRYKQIFLDRIEETVKIIQTTIDPIVKDIDAAIGEVTDQLKEAVDEMIEESEKKEVAYRKAKNKAQKQLEATIVSTPISNSASIVKLLGAPSINVIAESAETVDLNGGSLSLGNDNEIRPPTPLPPSIKKYADMAEADLKTLSKQRKSEINILIEESRKALSKTKEALESSKTNRALGWGWLEDIVSDIVEVVTDVVDVVVDAATDVYEAVATSLPMKMFDHLMNLIGANQDALFCTIEGFNEDTDGEDAYLAQVVSSVLNNLGDILKVAGISSPLAEKLKNDQEQLKRVTAMLEEQDGQTKDLQNYKQNVKALAGPFKKQIIDDMEDAKQRMANGSAVSLRVQKWEIQGTLRELSSFLRDISQAFPDTANAYGELVSKLEEGMNVLIDLYAFIQQYTDHMQFADFIANLNTPKAEGIKLGKAEEEMFEKINLALLGSMILSEWDTTIQNFDQWVFPFSDVFQRSFASKRIPDYLSKDIKDTSALLNQLIPEIKTWVKDLDIELQKYRSSVFPDIDDQLINATFSSEFDSTFPYYVWKAEDHQEKIKSVLSGEQVTFSITPNYTYEHGMSAVKFTVAEIQPKSRKGNSDFQIQLNKLRVEMSHSGISRYHYEDSDYQMVGSKQTLQYNFERNTDGERLNRNEVYIKIQNGDPILSPYTIWTIQLFLIKPDPDFKWEELAKFSETVDIELIGQGTFVRKKEQQKLQSRKLPIFSNRRPEANETKARKNHLPLHYYRFKMCTFPSVSKNSALNTILSAI